MNKNVRTYRLIPLIRQDKNITYKNEKYPIDFQLILQNSNYFYKNQKRYEFIDDIELTQVPNNITKESMDAFIKSIQNDEFSINDRNIFSLHQLSIKYEVPKLTEITTEYIDEHNIDLIFDTIKYKLSLFEENKEEENEFGTKEEEEKLATDFFKYINRKELAELPVSILYRIINKPQMKIENMNEKQQKEFVEFLFRSLQKHGREASVLFSTIDMKKNQEEIIIRLINEYSTIFDFRMIDPLFLIETTQLALKEKERIQKENSSIIVKIEDERKINYEMKEKINKLENNENKLNKLNQQLFIENEELANSKEQLSIENEELIKFFSISQSSKIQNTFDRSKNQNVEQIEEKGCQLLESLISYSIELEKVEKLEKSPKWIMLCEHPDSESLMEEFYKNKSISPKSISYYKSILKAQLLKDLTEIDEKDPYKYCNTKKIIMFFNKFKNRYNIIDNYWVIIAQKLSKKYPIDFCISIPTFELFDILSLLINPISKKQGCIFNEKQCPQKLIDDFYDLFIEVDKELNKKSFKYISRQIEIIAIKYAKNLHPDIIKENFNEDELDDFSLFYSKILDKNILDDIQEICERIQIVNNISESITTPLNKEEFKDENFDYLDFSDIMDIDFNNFNSYIDKNPCSGYYICRFPQIKDKIAKIAECLKNIIYNTKFPLSLFEFRIFSGIGCIEFQVPSEIPNDLAEDFQEFLYKEILTHLTKVPKISNFSNFIPFLLANTPNFVIDICHSEHLRDIVINLISSPKEKLLKTEMLQFFKRFLPKIIEKLGTPKWMNYMNEELKYESKDEIIRFLTNPWRFALEDINKAMIEEYENKDKIILCKNIISLILNLSSDKSNEQLKECVRKDESELRDKIYNEYMKTKKNSKKETEIEKEINIEWIDYSKYIKSYLGSKLSTLPTTISNNIYQPDDSYSSFHKFFSQKLNYLPCRSTEVIALLPKKSNSSTYTLFYTINNQKVSVKFQSSEGKPMLFLLPRNQTIESLNLQCEGVDIQIDVIQSDLEVVKFKYTSMKYIEESYKKFNKCFEDIQKADFEDSDHIQIIKKLGKTNIAFGDKTLDEFIEKLKKLSAKYIKDEIKNFYDKPDELDKIRDDILELEEFTNISFLIDHMDKPHQTTDFLQGNLINIITLAKNNLVKSNFDLFSNEYDKKHKFFFDSKSEFQKLYKVSTKLQLRPKNARAYNVESSEQEINQMKASEQLLIPSIFINEEELKVTIKKIIVEVDPLVFGVEVSPLQICLENFTEKEIICEFDQDEEDLPIPKYRNETGFLIIEIPVESICSSGLKYAKNDESKQKKPTNKKNELIEKTFIFNGVITLSINDESIIPCTIEYHISLHYISLIEFISIKNNHFFAFKDNTIEVVPFLAGQNSKLIFEKFTDKAIKRNNMLDSINELNDNKATKPNFISRINCEDERSTDITTVFAKKKIENSYLSMNYEFGITKEQSLIASLHINTSPKLNKVDQVTLAIFSDPIRDFTDKDAIVNIGNLKRKVYFFVGILNNSNEPISPKNIELSAYTYKHNYYNFINAEYDENKNKNTIPPNQYGYAIYYFEARYKGPFPSPNKDKFNGSIKVTINGITQTLNFKYKINAIENQIEKFKYNINIFDCLYYDEKKESFTQSDVRTVFKDPIFQSCEKQILISPFCYSLYDKSSLLTRIEYDHNKGVLSKLIYDKSKPPIFEVFGFFSNQKRFMVVTIDRPERISMHDRNTYIFARIKDEPSTFFPLFCPIKNNNRKFDARKCTSDNIYRTFINFFLSLMPTHDRDARKEYSKNLTLDNLFDQTPLPSVYNLSFIIDLIGKGRKHLALNEVVPTIIRFTNDNEFRDHYQESRTQFKSDPQGQFYSFISALNELINKRYEYLQTTDYYLNLPIPFDVIEEKQNELFQKTVLNKDQIETNKYINDFKKNIENINNIEKEAIKKFIDKGFEITPVLKWTEPNGITASTIEELNEHKKHKTQQTINIKTIKDENSEINTKDIKSIEFPEKPTIKSIYDTFKDVMSSTYNLTYIIYSLKKNHQPLDRARNLLNQLIAIFLWQNECSPYIPFTSFAKCYNTAFSSMMQRLYNSRLKIINFPLFLLEKSDYNEFVQIPSLYVTIAEYPKFTQPGLTTNFIKIKPDTKNKLEKSDSIKDEEE